MDKEENINTINPIKKHAGRPPKLVNGIAVKKPEKPKLTLEQKQEIKLKKQIAREKALIANGQTEPKNKERFYCNNKELQAELMKWRDSHEIISERILSEELGRMLLAVGNKLLNHSNFRNYTKELKEDMRSYGLYKIIRGLKNYNFKFNNPFAWVTQAFYNAYLSVLSKHYKHINIKKEMLKKFVAEFECVSGVGPGSTIARCIKSYLGEDGQGSFPSSGESGD